MLPPPSSLPRYLLPMLLLNGLIQSLLSPYLSHLLLSPTSTLTLDGRLLSVFWSCMYLPFAGKVLYGGIVVKLETWWMHRHTRAPYAPLPPDGKGDETKSSLQPSVIIILLALASLFQVISFLLSLLFITPYFSASPPQATLFIRSVLFASAFLRNFSCAVCDYLITLTLIRLARHSDVARLPSFMATSSLWRYYGSLTAAAVLAVQSLIHVDSVTYTEINFTFVVVLCQILSLFSAIYVVLALRSYLNDFNNCGDVPAKEDWSGYLSHAPERRLGDLNHILPPSSATKSSAKINFNASGLVVSRYDVLYLVCLQSFLVYLTFTTRNVLTYVFLAPLLLYPAYQSIFNRASAEKTQNSKSMFNTLTPALLYLTLRLIQPNLTYLQSSIIFTCFPTGPFTAISGMLSAGGSTVACKVIARMFKKCSVRVTISITVLAAALFYPTTIALAIIPVTNATITNFDEASNSTVVSHEMTSPDNSWYFVLAGAIVFLGGIAGEMEFLPLLTLCTTSSVAELPEQDAEQEGANSNLELESNQFLLHGKSYEAVVAQNTADLMSLTTNESLFIDVTNILSDWITPSYVTALSSGGDYTSMANWSKLVSGVVAMKLLVGLGGLKLVKEEK
jgi:hypothetical protein